MASAATVAKRASVSSSSASKAALPLLLGQVEVAQHPPVRDDRHGQQRAHRRMVRREADRARIAGEVFEAQRGPFVQHDPEQPMADRRRSQPRPLLAA